MSSLQKSKWFSYPFRFKNSSASFAGFFVAAMLLMGLCTPTFGDQMVQQWGYEGGTGPLHWGEMEQDHDKHLMCREGVHQSPIDINKVLGFERKKLHIHYYETSTQIINNKHTILLKYEPGSYVEWGNEVFELIQFHFHHPSEHRLKGTSFPMEIHLVHKASDNEYVVLAVLVKLGEQNPHIQKLWDTFPEEIDRFLIHKKKKITAENFLPDSKSYYHYTGSLTTPPCTENVTWLILEEPIEISREQLEYFQNFIDHNARPIQKLHHRVIIKLQ